MAASDWTDTSGWVCDDHCLIKQVFNDSSVDLSKEVALETQTGYNLEKATITARGKQQHVGIYAGDDESYALFPNCFGAVIKKYHSVDPAVNVANAEDYSAKTLPNLPASGATAIRSTRIRTARNLKNFPFTNNMSKAQRVEIENILRKVFDGFSDPRLQGTYHCMAEMTEKKKRELIDAHYLYTDDDSTLEMCGVYDDWPHGRGIYINDAVNRDKVGTFIVWVGEEDQMRIMAMNKGSDCIAIWELFYKGLQAVHEGLRAQGQDYAFSDSLGYLATCPTNIGTGMRASVHVDLPHFATKQAVKDFVKAAGLPVDVRGTHGESKNTDGCTTYDISNKERLGSDCCGQITHMVEGVKLLLEAGEAEEEKASSNFNLGTITVLAIGMAIGAALVTRWRKN